MGIVENAAKWCEKIAADNSHGYSQYRRWTPDFDCSSLIISAFENAGLPVKSKYGATYTGNMRRAFVAAGFRQLSTDEPPKRGDVYLKSGVHTFMYLGGGKIVEANIDERGGIRGTKQGDQTGREIWITKYKHRSGYVRLRYDERETVNTLTIKRGTWWVRRGASTKYRAKGVAHGGEDYTYTQVKNGWYYLPAFGGWISGRGVILNG